MRLPHVIPFNQSPRYFFTACTMSRRKLLACELAFRALRDVWARSAELDGWYVGRFVVMPDHVHFFAMSAREAKPRGDFHKTWKAVTARRLARKLYLSPPIWQEDTFDHILRSAESYQQKWDYVRENPVRAGHCAKTEDWPWQGEINQLSFK